MWTLPVIFPYPVFRTLPYFIQCPEQIKSSITPCSSARCTNVSDISSRLLSIRIFTGYPRVATILLGFRRRTPCSVQYTDNAQGRDIEINFYRLGFTIKIIHDTERPETPVADQRIMHKINRPDLIQCLRCCQWCRITYR